VQVQGGNSNQPVKKKKIQQCLAKADNKMMMMSVP